MGIRDQKEKVFKINLDNKQTGKKKVKKILRGRSLKYNFLQRK